MFKLFSLIFYITPNWIYKIIFFNRPHIRNFYIDAKSFALIKIIEKLRKTNLSDLEENEIPNFRSEVESLKSIFRLKISKKKEIRREDIFLKGSRIQLRRYIPSKLESSKTILYFHGGGYVLNSIDTHDELVSYMSSKMGVEIFSLNYSLSPENKFPIQVNQAYEALKEIESRSISISNVSLCGDSAGGHLALSLTNKLIEDNQPLPGNQFLIYPMLDPMMETESYELFKKNFFLTKDTMEWFWRCFRNNDADNEDKKFNIMKTNECLELYPETHIVTAGFDPLCDEAEEFLFMLNENGVKVRQLHYPRLFHGFANVGILSEAKNALDDFLSEYQKIL